MWRFLLGAAALAVAPPPYTDTNSEVALRNLSAISAKDPGALSDSEGVEWVRARFAWIALLRLEGDERAQGEALMPVAPRPMQLAVSHEDQPRYGVPLQQLQATSIHISTPLSGSCL